MIEAYLRSPYQLLLVNPIARMAKDVQPEYITYLACLSGIMIIPALACHLPLLATLFLLFSGFLDTLDGTVARLTNKTSAIGSALDIISDRIVEFAIIFGLFAVDPDHRGWTTLLILGSCYLCITSFLIVGIFTPNHSQKGFHYNPGLIERAEAFLFFLAMIWLPTHFNALAILMTSLVLLTAYLHLKTFMQVETELATFTE